MTTHIELNPDCWSRNRNGEFKHHNEQADYLEDHPDDPYWMVHKILGTGPRRPDGTLVSNHNTLFMELWKSCREVAGYQADNRKAML